MLYITDLFRSPEKVEKDIQNSGLRQEYWTQNDPESGTIKDNKKGTIEWKMEIPFQRAEKPL